METLLAGGVSPTDVMLVFAFCEVRCAGQPEIYGRLPAALATLASILARSESELGGDVLVELLNPGGCESAFGRLPAVQAQLARLEQVERVGELQLGSPPELRHQLRLYGAMKGLRMPKVGSPSPAWRELLGHLHAEPPLRELALYLLLRTTRVVTFSGDVTEPLDEETTLETLATHLAVPTESLRLNVVTMTGTLAGVLEAKRVATQLREQLSCAIGISQALEVEVRFEGRKHLSTTARPFVTPPWMAFPEPPTSLRWRMGPGEDHMSEWHDFWESLSLDARETYLAQLPPPPVWRTWLEQLFTDD